MRNLVVRVLCLASLLSLCASLGVPAGATQVGRAVASLAGAQRCSISGTRGQDVLKGTRHRDVICGLGSRDFVDGRGGDDLILGGGGNDWVRAGLGSDVVRGGAGWDTVFGQGGNDRLFGDGGADELSGGAGRDSLFGGKAADDCLDSHDGGKANDKVDGGPGVDLFWTNRGDATASAERVLPDCTAVYSHDRPGMFSPRVAADPQRVYVPDNITDDIRVIDPSTFRVIRRFRVGYPQHVTPSWNLRHLYTRNTFNGSLMVISPRRSRPAGAISSIGGPYNMYFTPDGSRALLVIEGPDRVDFWDPTHWRLIKRVSAPCSGIDHMDFTANGRFALASCEYDGMVVKLDTVRMRVVGRLHVGGKPIDVKLSPSGRVFYVANQGLSGVHVIDANRLRELQFIHTGVGAHGFAISRDAKDLYVANRIEGTISVIRFATRKVVAKWNEGRSPDMEQVSPNGKQLWVSDRYDGSVTVINTTTGHAIHRVKVGPKPHGLAYFPQPGRYSVGHNGVYR